MSTKLKIMLNFDTVILTDSSGVKYTVKDFLKLAEQLTDKKRTLNSIDEKKIMDLSIYSKYLLSNNRSHKKEKNDFVSKYYNPEFKNSKGVKKYIISDKWLLKGKNCGYGDSNIKLKPEEPVEFSYLKHILDESGIDFPDTAYNHFIKLATIHNEEDGDHYGSYYKKAFYVIDLYKLYDEIQNYNNENIYNVGIKP